MILLNDKPVKFEEYSLYFMTAMYADDTLAIVCETEDGEPYGMVTINLSDYGMYPPNGCVFLSHNLSNDFKQLVIDMFGKETFPIRYGYATSVGIILKDEIKDKINGKKQMGLTGYEKYQLEWMIEHGYSLERLMECLEEVRMSLENSTDGIASIEDIFDIWEDEKGFNSEIWVCEGEWEMNEALSDENER